MSSILNTVSKESINAKSIMSLPFVDVDIDTVILPISNDIEARMLLVEVRGF